MSLFDGQPDASALRSLLGRERVEIALCMFMDFADESLHICSRTVGFTDIETGQVWSRGDGLLFGIPNIDFADGNLAPDREYILGIHDSQVDAESWRQTLIDQVDDTANYQGREYALRLQVFDNGSPVGHPIYIDKGKMSRQVLRFETDIVGLKMYCEAGASRLNVPSSLLLTNADQKHLYPTDLGCEFLSENNNEVIWTQF